nr:4-galactosyl-N-acetylglucosaminide 3-alpha-L-fucosyltransferase 9 isoform X2 [Dasypus novemcinctus]
MGRERARRSSSGSSALRARGSLRPAAAVAAAGSPAPVPLLGRRCRRPTRPAAFAAQPSRAPRMELYPPDRLQAGVLRAWAAPWSLRACLISTPPAGNLNPSPSRGQRSVARRPASPSSSRAPTPAAAMDGADPSVAPSRVVSALTAPT